MQNNQPQVAVAIRNGATTDQLPRYGNTYYLNDGQEFIIMLYNPTDKKLAAKIYLNGHAESSMIIVKPGQRLWLERFIDVDRKYVFETYEVENTNEAAAATAKNGMLRVEFYDEQWPMRQIVYPYTVINEIHYPPYMQPVQPNPWQSPPIWCGNTTGSVSYSSCTTGNAPRMSSDNLFSANVEENQSGEKWKEEAVNCYLNQHAELRETGRIEKGDASGQQLRDSYDQFNAFYSYAQEFKLMPMKYKPVEKVETYCTKCGRKQKRGDVYCASCGNKY